MTSNRTSTTMDNTVKQPPKKKQKLEEAIVELERIQHKWELEKKKCERIMVEHKEQMNRLHIHYKMRENTLFDQVIFPDDDDYPAHRTVIVREETISQLRARAEKEVLNELMDDYWKQKTRNNNIITASI